GTGNLDIGEGAALELGGTTTNSVTFEGFDGTKFGELIIDSPNGYTTTINNFAGNAPGSVTTSDAIALTGNWTTTSQLTGDCGPLTVVLTDGGDTATFTFADFS